MDEPQPNGDLKRIHAYMAILREIWDTFGLPTILLAVILALWTGWLPSPLSEAKTTMDDVAHLIEDHVSHDDEVMFYLKRMCQSNAKLANMPIEECNWRVPAH